MSFADDVDAFIRSWECPPHDVRERMLGPFHPDFVKNNRKLLDDLCRTMSPYVCRKCGLPFSKKNQVPEWLAERIRFGHGEWCHAGGWLNWNAIGTITDPHPNYGYPHVLGTVYWDDGTISVAERCIFCGHQPQRA